MYPSYSNGRSKILDAAILSVQVVWFGFLKVCDVGLSPDRVFLFLS